MSTLTSTIWPKPLSRRILALMLVIGTLLILGFHTVTDAERLNQSTVLGGADYVGYAVCHRITDRSFAIGGRQLPLCARCTGMYLGVSLTFLVLGLAGRRRWSLLPPLPVLLVLLGFVAIMGIDGLNSYSHFFPSLPHLYEPHNWLRLVTGMGAGLAVGNMVFPGLAQTLWRDQEAKAAMGSLRELTALLLLAVLAIALVLSNQPAILYVLGLVSAVGVLLVLTAINSMTLLIALKRDARASGWRQAAVPLLIGLGLAIAEIMLIDFARYSLTGTMAGIPGI
jgi:uncharacterized membrane protein